MAQQTRRAFLAGTGVLTAALAGCSQIDNTTQGDEPNNNGGDSADTGLQLIDSFERNYSIEEDNWKGREFNFTSRGRVEYEAVVREGPSVDIYVMERSEYEHFQNEERFTFFTEATRQDTTYADVSGTLAGGDYAFIVDNSSMGEASPPSDFENNVATVDVTFKMFA